MAGVLAVLELEDGSVMRARPERVRFADGNSEFYEMAWYPPPEKKEDV